MKPPITRVRGVLRLGMAGALLLSLTYLFLHRAIYYGHLHESSHAVYDALPSPGWPLCVGTRHEVSSAESGQVWSAQVCDHPASVDWLAFAAPLEACDGCVFYIPPGNEWTWYGHQTQAWWPKELTGDVTSEQAAERGYGVYQARGSDQIVMVNPEEGRVLKWLGECPLGE